MKILFELDGRSIDPDKLTLNGGTEMRRMLLMKQDIERQLAGLIDPKTGQPPELLIKGKDLTDMQISTSNGPAMAAEIRKRLGVK